MTTKNDPFAAAKKASTPKAKKSSVPSINVTDPEVAEAVADWIEADTKEKDAKAKKAAAEDCFLDVAEQERRKASAAKGDVVSSVRLSHEDGQAITVTRDNRYSAIDEERKNELRQRFGDKTDDYFKTDRTISVRKDLDREAVNELVSLVGVDRLAEFFEVKDVLTPTKRFHEDASTDPKVGAAADALQDAGIVRPYKAKVRAHKGKLSVAK